MGPQLGTQPPLGAATTCPIAKIILYAPEHFSRVRGPQTRSAMETLMETLPNELIDTVRTARSARHSVPDESHRSQTTYASQTSSPFTSPGA